MVILVLYWGVHGDEGCYHCVYSKSGTVCMDMRGVITVYGNIGTVLGFAL